MPSFGGAAIFGLAVQMRTVDNPPADQINAFFGASGMESLFGGTRGRVTFVDQGILFGSTAGALLAAEVSFRSFNDGMARTLVDSYGYSWPYVKYGTFEPVEKIMNDGRGYWRKYRATFLHLL